VSYHRALVGVRPDGHGEFEIWGIVYSGPQWLHAAQGGRPARSMLPPSSLVVRVTGPGLVAVARGGATLCALHAGRIGGSAMDVFSSRWLAQAFVDLRAELTALHIAERSRVHAPWAALDAEVIALVAPQMLKRLVTTILRTRHGGILILVPSDRADLSAGAPAILRIKYAFCEEEPRRRYRTLIVAKLRALASAARRSPAICQKRDRRRTSSQPEPGVLSSPPAFASEASGRQPQPTAIDSSNGTQTSETPGICWAGKSSCRPAQPRNAKRGEDFLAPFAFADRFSGSCEPSGRA